MKVSTQCMAALVSHSHPHPIHHCARLTLHIMSALSFSRSCARRSSRTTPIGFKISTRETSRKVVHVCPFMCSALTHSPTHPLHVSGWCPLMWSVINDDVGVFEQVRMYLCACVSCLFVRERVDGVCVRLGWAHRCMWHVDMKYLCMRVYVCVCSHALCAC